MKLFFISVVVLGSLISSAAFACIDFPLTYRCTSAAPSQEYDITLALNSSGTIPVYTVTRIFRDRTENYSLQTDGKEVQFVATPADTLYRSATCSADSLTLNMREVTTSENAKTQFTVASVYQLMASGKLLRIDTTATVERDGAAPASEQTTDFCLYKH